MKKLITIIIFLTLNLSAQNRWFSMPSFWEVGGPGMAFNIEAFDMNKDSHLDVVVGNWNNTYVYFGGYGILDDTVDVTYTGRMLAVCDYNGDGFDDMIAMHFTNFDSSRFDYDGEILFYWGSDTTELAIDTVAGYSIPLPTLYPTIESFTVGLDKVGIEKGDLNGDGKCDLVFNSYEYRNPNPEVKVGGIYVYMGKEMPTDTADFFVSGKYIPGQILQEYYGHFFQIGNINGDSFDDLLISSGIRTLPFNPKDSLDVLQIYYGKDNFICYEGAEEVRYESRVNPQNNWADWFVRSFSVDDINADGTDDLVVGRSSYNYPERTTIHYGSITGIDTIPSFIFIQDTTNPFFWSAGGVTQNIGDYNMDGYDDFIMSPAGYQQFALHFGTPYPNNINRYGARGYSNANGVFPEKGVNMGNQTNDGVNDIAVISNAVSKNRNGYILMLYGQNIPTDVEILKEQPEDFYLNQNYPNPFNPSTVIDFQITTTANVKLIIYDSLGKEIDTLINDELPAGNHQVEFDASKYNLSSGVYFCKLKVKGGGSSTIKIVFLK